MVKPLSATPTAGCQTPGKSSPETLPCRCGGARRSRIREMSPETQKKARYCAAKCACLPPLKAVPRFDEADDQAQGPEVLHRASERPGRVQHRPTASSLKL